MTPLFVTFFEDENEATDEDNNLNEDNQNQRRVAPRASNTMPHSNERRTRSHIGLGVDYAIYRIPVPYYNAGNNEPGFNRVRLSFHRYYIKIRLKDRRNGEAIDEIVHLIPIPGNSRMLGRMRNINVYQGYLSIRFHLGHRRHSRL